MEMRLRMLARWIGLCDSNVPFDASRDTVERLRNTWRRRMAAGAAVSAFGSTLSKLSELFLMNQFLFSSAVY